MDGGGLEPGHLREVGAEESVELSPEVEAGGRGEAARSAAGLRGGWEGVHGGIDLGREGPEPRLHLAVTLPEFWGTEFWGTDVFLGDVATFVTLWNQPGNGGGSNDGSGQGSEVRKQRSEESATDVRNQG
jgi:hypothetical protein